MNVLVKMLDQTLTENLRSAFYDMDKDQTGMITVTELQEALMSHGQNLSQEEILQIVRNIDYAGNGKINYSEFLVATVEVKTVLT